MNTTHPQVAVKFDPTTEEKQVHVTLSGAEAEFLEEMYVVTYGMITGLLQKRRGDAAASQESTQGVQHAMRILMANGDVARAISAIVKAVHCELHHAGQSCEEAHAGEEDWNSNN